MKRLRGRLVATIAALIFLAFFTVNVDAANRPETFYLSPMAGGHVFEGDQDLEDALTYSLGLGYNFTDTWSTEFVLNYFNADSKSSTGDDVDGLVYRLDTLYHFLPKNTFVPFISGGLGGISLDPDNSSSNSDFLLNYGVGLKYFLNDSMALRGDLRHIYAFGDPQNNFVYTAGIIYQFGGGEKSPTRVTQPLDSDEDGAVDGIDQCPGTPKGVAVDSNGCPLDSDGDGVADYQDKCPDTRKNARVDKWGCPLDSDGDGVYDYLDQCPATPAGVTVNERGCPVDSDGDGISDHLDQCPDTRQGLTVDNKGCPISMTLSVEFDIGKEEIQPKHYDELARGAAFIKKNAGQKILIAGHTDSTGTAAYNQALSQRRADSVRDYLVKKFKLDASRLFARGFGESAPVAGNDTAEGRQLNRRVELSCCSIIPD